MSETVLGFQPAVATTLDQVVAAMDVTHDVLISRSGRSRASGIHWDIFGTELAGVLARTRGGGSPHGPAVAGTFSEGLDRLTAHLDGAVGSGDSPEAHAAAVRDLGNVRSEATDDPVALLRAAAEGFPTPTLIIAYCAVRVRTGSRR